MSKPTYEQLYDILKMVKKEFPWMLADIKHRADLINLGSYSDELESALAVGELLDIVE